MTTVAIMQPYFLPYAGYFRLCAASDIFVLLDDVQFPRRGWVHRNRLRDRQGRLSWLTMPLAKGGRDTTRIVDLRFRPDAGDDVKRQLHRFPLFDAPAGEAADVAATIAHTGEEPANYLRTQLDQTCRHLGWTVNWLRSSRLELDPELRSWQRLVAIAKNLGADTYINAPGGQALYDAADFRRAGVRLRLLTPYDGKADSILQRLHDDGAARVRAEIERNIRFSDHG